MIKIKPFFVFTLVLLSICYLFIRIQNLTSMPIFGDEAIYVRWSQIIKNVETLRYVPMTDGKQPLYMWITAMNLKNFQDPLVAGRMVSVVSGLLTMITIYIFLLFFFNFPLAVIGAVVYLLLPFTFFFDRLATADTLLSLLGIISMLLSFLLARYPRYDIAMILGVALGISWMTKSPAIFFIILSIITFVLYDKKNIKKTYLPLLSAIIAFIIYNTLRLGPQFHQIALRNKDYVWSFSEILKHPFDPFMPHISDVIAIFSQYVSPPVIILTLIGIVLSKKHLFNHQKPNLVLLWFIFPLVTNMVFAKVFTARYILFTIPPLIIIFSFGIYYFFQESYGYFKNRILQSTIVAIFFSLNIFWIYHFSVKPFESIIPPTESGYITGWTSGWGIKEASQYLQQRSKVANVIVGTEGYFGTLPDGLQVYTDGVKNLTVFGVGIDLKEIPDKLLDAKRYGDEVYILINQSRQKLSNSAIDKVELVTSYSKPEEDTLQLFKLK